MDIRPEMIAETLVFRDLARASLAEDIAVDLNDWTPLAIAGLVHYQGKFVDFRLTDKIPETLTTSELLDAYGEWMAVLTRKVRSGASEYLIFTDENGFFPVFCSSINSPFGNSFIAGSSFGAVLEEGRRLGASYEPNWDVLLTYFLTPHPHLTTVAMADTFAESVQLLGAGKAIHVGSQGSQILSRPKNAQQGGLTYAAILDKGINRAVELIDSALCDDFGSQRLNLSGGLDSRLVLSLALMSGKSSRLNIVTFDPQSRKEPYAQKMLSSDLAVASELVDHFGLKWIDSDHKVKGRIDFNDRVAIHQAFRSGWNYAISIGNLIACDDPTSVSLRGGGGELLRTEKSALTMAEYAASNGGSERVDRKTAVLMSRRLTGCTSELQKFGFHIPESLIEIFLRGGGTPLAAANKWYADYRSRAHFGHHRMSLRVGNNLTVHPLAIKEFREATALLSPEERDERILPFDVIEKTCPFLNEVPFANWGWGDLARSRAGARGRAFPGADAYQSLGEAGRSTWKSSQERLAILQSSPAQVGWWGTKSPDSAYIPKDWRAEARCRLEEVLREATRSAGGPPVALVEHVIHLVDSGKRPISPLFGKALDLEETLGVSKGAARAESLVFVMGHQTGTTYPREAC